MDTNVISLIIQLNESFQSSYKEWYITDTAMLKILNELLNFTENGDISSMLDMSAAFYTLDHAIMCQVVCYFWNAGRCIWMDHIRVDVYEIKSKRLRLYI